MPKIIIRYSPLIDGHYRLLSNDAWRSHFKKSPLKGIYPSESQIHRKIKKYQAHWNDVEKVILSQIQNISGLHFSEKEIVVYIVGFGGAQSDPLVIPSHYPPREFIGVLAHELLHRLLTYNQEGFNEDIHSPILFKNENSTTAIHIVIHALLEHLYLEVLHRPALVQWDKRSCATLPDYKRAWELVEKTGYRTIIKLMREAR